uniref:RING-type domain-containing protein n=1 Tax=Panagrolaimus superbus TaxID=310955 RepID=A0A914XQ24_9BILA
MNESFAQKANKGRCLAFPGYCDKTIATCDLAHPLVNCDRYPACTNSKCTYLHPVCNYDCKKELCKKPMCRDYHPWRDSYMKKKGKRPDSNGSDIDEYAVIPDSAIVADLIAKYQKEYESPSNNERSPSTIAALKTQQSDYLIQEEIMKVWERIVQLNYHDTIRDREFMRGKCFDCRNAPATIILLSCSHLIFCNQCFFKFKRNPKCLLCGKISEGHIDVFEN